MLWLYRNISSKFLGYKWLWYNILQSGWKTSSIFRNKNINNSELFFYLFLINFIGTLLMYIIVTFIIGNMHPYIIYLDFPFFPHILDCANYVELSPASYICMCNSFHCCFSFWSQCFAQHLTHTRYLVIRRLLSKDSRARESQIPGRALHLLWRWQMKHLHTYLIHCPVWHLTM